MGNLTHPGASKKDSLEVLIDLFVMATFPCALFNRVKNQSQWLMKPSICHIMSQVIMEGFFSPFKLDTALDASGTYFSCVHYVEFTSLLQDMARKERIR